MSVNILPDVQFFGFVRAVESDVFMCLSTIAVRYSSHQPRYTPQSSIHFIQVIESLHKPGPG